ncbi:DUF5825 family protein [Streptomyces sp. NPDC049837]|uniref:DUF5825 family protein n=1 Tax=Streptomyces sp. NPDC049837 TaxID=3155277 RepID=UPI003429B4D5
MHIDELKARGPDEGRPAAGRPATLTLAPDWAELPVATELAALLLRVPVAGVRLPEPADFSALPDHTIVRIIALLRECSSIGARVIWSLNLGAEQQHLIRQLDHLPAPDTSVGEWRSSSNFGLLYFRKGPKFLSVIDERPEHSRRVIVDDPATMAVFVQALDGCAWTEVTRTPQYAAAARDLVKKGLLLRVGDQCVTLPVHMRSWPIGTVLLGGTLASAGKKSDDANG